MQATTTAEEERLNVDFFNIWEQRAKQRTLEMVQEAEKPREGAQAIHFDSNYSQGCALGLIASRDMPQAPNQLHQAAPCLSVACACWASAQILPCSSAHRGLRSRVTPPERRGGCRRVAQYKELAMRYFKAYWRSPPYNTTRLILAVISALILGTFYWSRGDNYGGGTGAVTAILGSLLASVQFCGFVNFQMIIPTFLMERPVMYRERAARMYAVLPWVQSMQDVEIPWIALQARPHTPDPILLHVVFRHVGSQACRIASHATVRAAAGRACDGRRSPRCVRAC